MLESMASGEGIEIGTPPIQSNSHLAFELATLAKHEGKAEALHRELFRAYFTDKKNIGDLGVLLEVAKAAGLDPEETARALADHRYRDEVDEEIAWAREAGITSTPTFIFDERYAVVGAQEYSAFERVAEKLGHKKLES
jgi:predicted DsbA family dithiol-disulfide isomerase